MELTWGFLIAALALSGVCLVGAVVSTWGARRATRVSEDFDDLAITVERLAKAQRRERMSRVRASTQADTEAPAAPPPEFNPNAGASASGLVTDRATHKAALRRRLARGNGL